MSVVKIEVKKPDGRVVDTKYNFDPDDHEIKGTNPQRYEVDVEAQALPSDVTYSLTVTPNDYHRVAQVASSNNPAIVGRFEMESGGGAVP